MSRVRVSSPAPILYSLESSDACFGENQDVLEIHAGPLLPIAGVMLDDSEPRGGEQAIEASGGYADCHFGDARPLRVKPRVRSIASLIENPFVLRRVVVTARRFSAPREALLVGDIEDEQCDQRDTTGPQHAADFLEIKHGVIFVQVRPDGKCGDGVKACVFEL